MVNQFLLPNSLAVLVCLCPSPVAMAQSTARPSVAGEVTTPLYSSARPSSVMIEKREPPSAPESDTASGRTPTVATRRTSTIDESTRWQFVSRENIVVDRPIIRLADVVRPLEPDLVAWARLGQSTIGLMPADGGDAKVSRDRLAQLIAGANATPGRIKIYGPDTIVVQRARTIPAAYEESTASVDESTVSDSSLAQTAYQVAPDLMTSSETPLDTETRERLEQWVRVGVRSQFRDLDESFRYDVHFEPSEFGTLENIQGIRQFVFLDPAPIWSHESNESVKCRVRLLGRAGSEDCEGIVRLTFHPRPAIVTARHSLRRGQTVTLHDLQFEPYSVDGVSLPADVVAAPEELVGLEVIGLVRSGVALTRSAFAAPRVVRRGELLEVQVGGGGVRVTTGAKALADGAVGELIEIETLQPKRRLLAKVVNSSLVEIITRAPRVEAEPKGF
ncbi:flagellar basal body P-ring formation chaperone FlgA [Neorhodopirellula pilleata]|uniref:Flagellar basal body P-ring biosynthesis protein FlgA n=1 Tax=Neorhodopirellula pilleata TaxID=2714738 RepID=A0A5C5ZXE4_9BACT|nr:flagellar basal body P-ring formation chaperone FlgA [Neorhodopirellula pilleata]TWT91919.1 flagellar basal body P-ring biosynthesis protein FlgA [Neorhodopirellula pilleata]